MRITTPIRMVLPVAALAAFASPALGQTATGTPNGSTGAPTVLQENPAAQYSDDQLRSFADAVRDVSDVTAEYTRKLKDAGSQQEAASLQQEAEIEMIQAVEANDLSLEEYNGIATAAQNDPQMAETIHGHLKESD